VLERLAPGHLRLVGALGGDATFARSLATWLGLCLLLSFGFAYLASRSLNRWTDAVLGLTLRSVTLRRLVTPAVRRLMLGTTAAGVGTLFGLVAAVIVGFVGGPGAVAAATGYEPSLPVVDAAAGYVLTGTFVGAGYGTTLDDSLPMFGFGSDRGRGVVYGTLLGGTVGGAVLRGRGRRQRLCRPWAARLLRRRVRLDDGVRAEGRKTRGMRPGYVRRTALAGLCFGVLAGVALGLFAVPAVVNSETGSTLATPLGGRTILAGWAAFGLFGGYGYARGVQGESVLPETLVDRVGAVAAATLVTGTVGSVLLYLTSPLHLRFVGTLTRSGTLERGFLSVYPFALLAAVAVALFADEPARRSELRVGVTVSVLGVLFGTVALPLHVNRATAFTLQVPLSNPRIVLG
jgi:hypothetical protein